MRRSALDKKEQKNFERMIRETKISNLMYEQRAEMCQDSALAAALAAAREAAREVLARAVATRVVATREEVEQDVVARAVMAWNEAWEGLPRDITKKLLTRTELKAILKIKPAKQLHRPPGYRLMSILDFFYSPKAMKSVFEPLLADMQSEYFDALNQKRIWKARWIRVRYAWALGKTFGRQSVAGLIKQLIGAFKFQ